MAATQASHVVVLEYDDLVADADISQKLLEAWDSNGLGVVAIRGIPGWVETYSEALKQAHPLAHLPQSDLQALEDENSMYNAGWSHGKEKLGDVPDLAKGSFYFNPLSDEPGTAEDREKFPWALPRNVWPESLPEMKPALQKMGVTMHQVVGHLARLVDRTMEGRVAGAGTKLGPLMRDTVKCKGRLLFYFPPAQKTEDPDAPVTSIKEDGWIGWHNDSGFLTALSPDIYVDDETGEVVDNPDPEAGLYVVNRSGESVKVIAPRDCMCVQVGECTQVVTGGVLVATPHCVRGCRPSTTGGRRIARVSCPCFIDSHPTERLTTPEAVPREEVLSKGGCDKVPPLGDRWTENGQTFGDFLGATFRRYYEWAHQGPTPATATAAPAA